MNIDSVNLAPKPLGNKAIGGDTSASHENGQGPDSFASALKGQKKAFDGTDAGDETEPQQQLAVAKSQSNTDDVKNDTGEQKELVDFLDKYFPHLSANNENTTSGSETALLSFNEKSATPSIADLPADISTTQGTNGVMGLSGFAFAKPAQQETQLDFSPENAGQEVSLQKKMVSWQLNQTSQAVNPGLSGDPETFKTSLDTLTGTESPAPGATAVSEAKAEFLQPQKPADARMENAAIAKPITHPGWSKDLGEHIIWMNNKAISAAEIKMNPEHLGPISVRIDISHDNQASILFTAQHAETKEALESSIPKLKEMLLGQQLNLVNVNISHNPGSHHGRTPHQPFSDNMGRNGPELGTSPQVMESGELNHVVSKGLLSLYA